MNHLQNFKESANSRYTYQKELDKACFQHDMTTRSRVSDKMLHDKSFNFTKNPKNDGCQSALVSMIYKVFDKKSASLARLKTLAMRDKSASGSSINNENISDKELAQGLQNSMIKSFKRRKVLSSFIDNTLVVILLICN